MASDHELGTQQQQRALHESLSLAGLEDHHEAQRDERVDGPERDPADEQGQELGHGADSSGAGVVAPACSSPEPRYARMTSGSLCTWAGVPSAMRRPKSSTVTWSAMPMTMPMSCSTRTTVMPRASRISSTMPAIRCVSSAF